MVVKPFLSPRFMEQGIPTLRARGLETSLGIDGQMIAFDRKGAVIGPIEVVIEWANRVPAGVAGGATRVIGTEGELLGRVGEFEARAGDLFMIAGYSAEITVAAKEDRGVMVAGFRMTGGQGGA